MFPWISCCTKTSVFQLKNRKSSLLVPFLVSSASVDRLGFSHFSHLPLAPPLWFTRFLLMCALAFHSLSVVVLEFRSFCGGLIYFTRLGMVLVYSVSRWMYEFSACSLWSSHPCLYTSSTRTSRGRKFPVYKKT